MRWNAPDLVAERLAAEGVRGVERFKTRLFDNLGCQDVYLDYMAEAFAAVTLRCSGLDVEMRDRPDLALSLNGYFAFGEVKHFRRKIPQDLLDDEALANARGTLVPYGDTLESEGRTVEAQVLATARKKASQLPDGVANLLVLHSSSPHCLEDDLALTRAIADIHDAVAAGDQTLRRLSGALLLCVPRKCPGGRNAYFAMTQNPTVSFPLALRERLERIDRWNYAAFDPD